ncbi:MAG: hypothetical protein QOF30_74 [Acidimicrobiaceae bacterium]|jgi:lysophospholipase L1-like esterase|nr:hypothetical protein [Acidimicrobiaceae bacterium]
MKLRSTRILGLALSTILVGACSAAATGAPRSATDSDLAASQTPPAVAAASPLRSAGSTPVLDDRRVFVEGDSLTVGVAPFLPALLGASGWSVTMDDEIGRTTAEGISIVAQRRWAVGGTLVVALGTNDLPDPTEFALRIDEVMTLAAGRRVIWVTIARAGWDGLDRALFVAEARWPDLHVIDWRPFVAAWPAIRAADGIHLTLEGYELRAQFIASAIESVPAG